MAVNSASQAVQNDQKEECHMICDISVYSLPIVVQSASD